MQDSQLSSKDAWMVKRPSLRHVELTQEEMERLLRAFTKGKTEILEEDALTLVRWAHHMRMGAVVLDMVLAGDLIPVVDAGVIKVSVPDSGGPAR